MVLCCDFRGYRGTYQYTLPPAADVPLFVEYDSLYRFLERATAADPGRPVPERRRDGRAARGRAARAWRRSSRDADRGGQHLLHRRERTGRVDLWLAQPAGAARQSRRSGCRGRRDARGDGAGGGRRGARRAGRPRRRGRAAACPRADRPRPARRGERACSTTSTRRCASREPGRTGASAGTGAWRPWPPVRRTMRPARCCEVYRYLPGELAPKLALGHAAEQAGDHASGRGLVRHREQRRSRLTAAVFGLARARSAMGDRRGAIAAYERIPHSSGAYQAAQIAEVDLLLTDDGAGADLADVRRAAAIVEGLSLDQAQHDRLTVDILEAAHDAVSRNGTTIDPRAAGPRPRAHRPFPAPGPRSRVPRVPPATLPRAPSASPSWTRPTGCGPGRGG